MTMSTSDSDTNPMTGPLYGPVTSVSSESTGIGESSSSEDTADASSDSGTSGDSTDSSGSGDSTDSSGGMVSDSVGPLYGPATGG